MLLTQRNSSKELRYCMMEGMLAVIDWAGVEHIGMRWNVAIKEQADANKQNGLVICAGSPSQNGVPSWFILPRELFNPVLFDKDSEGFMKMVNGWAKPSRPPRK